MRKILLTLALLAMACAQIFGTQRAHLCDHGTMPLRTIAEHCHKGFFKADIFAVAVPCLRGDTTHCEENGPKESHHPLYIDLQIPSSSLTVVMVPAFVAVPVYEFSVFSQTALLLLVEDKRMGRSSFKYERPDHLPNAAVLVASCIVILV